MISLLMLCSSFCCCRRRVILFDDEASVPEVVEDGFDNCENAFDNDDTHRITITVLLCSCTILTV